MCGVWTVWSQVCGCVSSCVYMRRLQNDFECLLSLLALLLWGRVSRLAVVWLCWLASELSGFIPSPSARAYSHAWIFMWAWDIQTQNLMLTEQVRIPTEPPLQPPVEALKEASHLRHGSLCPAFFQRLFGTQLVPPKLIISPQLFLMMIPSPVFYFTPSLARQLSSGCTSASTHHLPFVL